MALLDRRRRSLDRLPVGDVADLVLAGDLLGERPQAVLAPREEDTEVATRGELADERGADAARGARDDGDAAIRAQRQTRTRSRAVAVFPFASVATVFSTCAPRFALPAFQLAP
jgi:hypothetical protein